MFNQPFEVSGLGFDSNQKIGQIALRASRGRSGGPTAESGAQFEHSEAIFRASDSFKQIDPLEIFFLESRVIRRNVALLGLWWPHREVLRFISGAEEIRIESGG